MAKYRTYKNGIYGHKYKGYYIIKDDPKDRKSTFSVVNEKKEVVAKDYQDFHEAEWKIDRMTLSGEERTYVESLCKLELYELSRAMSDYLGDDRVLTKEEEQKSGWIEKIRRRKSLNLALMD